MIISEILEQIRTFDNPGFLFFRGHSDISWELKSSIYREKNYLLEDFFYHQIQLRCPEEFSNLSYLDKLAKMQHYGCPTRLLDITSNPLVALYFACNDFVDKNGCIYCFNCRGDALKGPESDTALILSVLPKLSQDDKNSISQSNFQLNRYGFYFDESVEKLFYEISKERPTFFRKFSKNIFQGVHFVQPRLMNQRIKNQKGAFLEFGLGGFDILEDLKFCYKIEVKKRYKEEIIQDLEKLGIDKTFLFPDILSVSEYLRDKAKQLIFPIREELINQACSY